MPRLAILSLTLCILAITSGCYSRQQAGNMNFPEGKVQHVVRASSIQWMPCPPGLPDGCRLAVLEGSPKKPGLFTVRFSGDNDLYLRPHTHPKDERVTILKGKVAVAFGSDSGREQATEFGPGDYYVNAHGAVHQVWAEKGSILQITGVGPWEVNYVSKK